MIQVRVLIARAGIIERSCNDGQRAYYSELEASMRKYIAEHRSEFLPEGVDAAAADEEAEQVLSPVAPKDATSQPGGEKPVATTRGLQWALDTFEAATKVATDSLSGLFDIVSDLAGGFTLSKTTVLGSVIALLVASNIYTIMAFGDRQDNGRRQTMERRVTERERWIAEAVRVFMQAQQSLQDATPEATSASVPVSQAIKLGEPKANVKTELEELRNVVMQLEERLVKIRSSLDELE